MKTSQTRLDVEWERWSIIFDSLVLLPVRYQTRVIRLLNVPDSRSLIASCSGVSYSLGLLIQVESRLTYARVSKTDGGSTSRIECTAHTILVSSSVLTETHWLNRDFAASTIMISLESIHYSSLPASTSSGWRLRRVTSLGVCILRLSKFRICVKDRTSLNIWMKRDVSIRRCQDGRL